MAPQSKSTLDFRRFEFPATPARLAEEPIAPPPEHREISTHSSQHRSRPILSETVRRRWQNAKAREDLTQMDFTEWTPGKSVIVSIDDRFRFFHVRCWESVSQRGTSRRIRLHRYAAGSSAYSLREGLARTIQFEFPAE
jgi:hypothetical protein